MKFALILTAIFIIFVGGFVLGLFLKEPLVKLFNNIYQFIKNR